MPDSFRTRVRLKAGRGNLSLLRGGRPTLRDAPARLRLLADQLEAGDRGEAAAVIVVVDKGDPWPSVLSFGQYGGEVAAIGLLELAKGFLVSQDTVRST